MGTGVGNSVGAGVGTGVGTGVGSAVGMYRHALPPHSLYEYENDSDHSPNSVQKPVSQSESTRHPWKSAHGGQSDPPQSTSVSSQSISPLEQ